MTVIRELLTSKKFVAALAAIIVYVAGRFGLDIEPGALDPIWQALLVYVGAQGVADAGKAAAQVRAANVQAEYLAADAAFDAAQARARRQQGGFVDQRVIAALGIASVIGIAVVAGSVASCTTARQRSAAAAGAFIDCATPNIQASVAELLPLATQAVLAAISGDGRHVDTDRLREAARPMRSDLGRCALAGAIAAIATPALTPRARAEQVMAAGLEVDGPALRAAFASVRAELGWPQVRGPGGAQ